MAYGNNRQERPDDTIALFKNDERRNDKDPAYKGQGKINGRDYWASAWINESRKDGSKYLSIKVKPKQEARRESYDRAQAPSRDRDDPRTRQSEYDDEIPF